MFSDLKFTIRALLKTPAFTTVAILTLALGIGATTAIFSVVNTVLLKPLPYVQPERLARVYTEFPKFPNGGMRRNWVSPGEYLDLKREAKSWQSLDAWLVSGANMATAAEPTRVSAAFVTGGMLPSLGIAAKLGRLVTPQDDAPGATPTMVISYGLWRRVFGADPAIVGRDILLNGRKHTVVGVMPESFSFPPGETDAPDVWTPLQIDPTNPGERGSHNLSVLGRLKPGITLSQARTEIDALLRYWGQTGSGHYFDSENHTIALYDLHEEVVRNVRTALRMLFGAVCFLLLIACVNVANLLLARAEARQREIAIRGALGAGGWRLAGQFAMEGLTLACSGAAVGLVLAQGSLTFLKSASAASIPRAADISIDGHVVIFALAVSLLTGLAFGSAPLVHVLKRNLHYAMKAGAASTTAAAGIQRFRQGLIVAQLSLALVLLTGAGLMLKGFWKLQQVDAGFDPNHVTSMFVALPDSGYSREATVSFWTRLQERLEASPGIESAALTTALPTFSDTGSADMKIEGFVPVKGGPIEAADFVQFITPGYFDTLRVRQVAGRLFDKRDGMQAPRVAIVNQTMARTFWGNGNAIGRRIRPPFAEDWYTVVGVTADVKNRGVGEPTGSTVYLPFAQAPSHTMFTDWFLRLPYIIIRSQGNPLSMIGAVRREIHDIDPALPLAKVRTMDEVIAASQSRPRFLAVLLTLFAGVALALAAVGIYGVISYAVAQRTREFGLRMALGAQPGAVLRLVLKRGALLTACGVGIGIAGAFTLTRFLSGFLFGVTATDPATYVAVALLLGVIAVLASYIPARRATRVDPLVALRTE